MVSGGALHPLEILERVTEALERGARGGVAPNEVLVGLHPNDWERLEGVAEELTRELRAALLEQERTRGQRRVGDLRVTLEPSRRAAEGAPEVSARFVDTSIPVARRGASNPTRRMLRHRGVTLVLSDGRRVSVTHTPFVIGRSPDCDLALASLAVSREHAEIIKVADGFAIRDLGSRNGVVVAGERVAHAVLGPGVGATVGDVTIWVEGQQE